jgi:hypothetical protein
MTLHGQNKLPNTDTQYDHGVEKAIQGDLDSRWMSPYKDDGSLSPHLTNTRFIGDLSLPLIQGRTSGGATMRNREFIILKV